MQIGIDSFVINTPDPATNNGISTAERMSNLLGEIECADQAGIHVFGIGEHHRADFADSAPSVILAAAAGRTQRIRLTSAVTVLSAHDPVRAARPDTGVDLMLGVGGTPESFVRAGTLGLPLMIAIIGGDPRNFRPLVDLYRQAGEKAGHPPDRLTVGVHAIGYVAKSNEQAANDFAPGYLRSFNEVGKERGWGPTTRAHFDAAVSPRGALLVGDPETVAKKIAAYDTTLGGISRITFQMSVAGLPHDRALESIELIGRQVAPLVA